MKYGDGTNGVLSARRRVKVVDDDLGRGRFAILDWVLRGSQMEKHSRRSFSEQASGRWRSAFPPNTKTFKFHASPSVRGVLRWRQPGPSAQPLSEVLRRASNKATVMVISFVHCIQLRSELPDSCVAVNTVGVTESQRPRSPFRSPALVGQADWLLQQSTHIVLEVVAVGFFQPPPFRFQLQRSHCHSSLLHVSLLLPSFFLLPLLQSFGPLNLLSTCQIFVHDALGRTVHHFKNPLSVFLFQDPHFPRFCLFEECDALGPKFCTGAACRVTDRGASFPCLSGFITPLDGLDIVTHCCNTQKAVRKSDFFLRLRLRFTNTQAETSS